MFLKDEECFVVFRNMFRTFKLKVAKVGPWLSKTGSYTFQLDSDDGSRMYLEGLVRNAESRRKQRFAWRNVCKSENATEPHWFHIVFKSPHAAGGHAKRHGTSMAISNYYQKIGIWRAFVKCPCRRWNHRSRSLDQLLSTFCLPEWIWMDVFLGFCLFRCKIFHTEDGCRATSQVGPVTPPKQYSKQMLKGHYEIKHSWPYLFDARTRRSAGETNPRSILELYYICCTQMITNEQASGVSSCHREGVYTSQTFQSLFRQAGALREHLGSSEFKKYAVWFRMANLCQC